MASLNQNAAAYSVEFFTECVAANILNEFEVILPDYKFLTFGDRDNTFIIYSDYTEAGKEEATLEVESPAGAEAKLMEFLAAYKGTRA